MGADSLISTAHKASSTRTVLTLSALAALTGLAAVQANRAIRRLRQTHLDFDFPIEEQLFIGWGGRPRRARRI